MNNGNNTNNGSNMGNANSRVNMGNTWLCIDDSRYRELTK